MLFITWIITCRLALAFEPSLTRGPAGKWVGGETRVKEEAKKLVEVAMADGQEIVKELEEEYKNMQKDKERFNKALQAMMHADHAMKVQPGAAIKAAIAVIEDITEFTKKFEKMKDEIVKSINALHDERVHFDKQADDQIAQLTKEKIIDVIEVSEISKHAEESGEFKSGL